MSEPRLVDVASADLEALSSLHGSSFAEGWSAQSLRALLSTPGCFALVVGETVPIGLIVARTASDEAEILTLVVSATVRRQDIGTRLVRAAAARAVERGAIAMFLEVGVHNAAARALYGKLGFAQVGERRGYYGSRSRPAEDALTLRAALPLAPLGKPGGVG